MKRIAIFVFAISITSLPGCNSTRDSENVPRTESPSPARTAATEDLGSGEPTPSSPAGAPASDPFGGGAADPFGSDPPAPSTTVDKNVDEPEHERAGEALDSEPSDNVFNSVGRVLRGSLVGEAESEDGESKGSIFGSVGRALSKGFQEATSEDAPNPDSEDAAP
jgi:hypothetical protein